MASATVIVPTRRAGPRLERMLRSLSAPGADAELIVVDNASGDARLADRATAYPGAQVVALQRNEGFSRAVNLAARRASGDALVLLNDDCVVAPGYVETICERLQPGDGVVMTAGVMCEQRESNRIDTAGIEIDDTLLIFDYLNGAPVTALERGVPDPIGPSGGAAAFDREAFLSVGGFDERLFAYWEDADLALRLRLAGGRCRLAPDARGLHEHAGTLGPGSAQKNYLLGFGRGYVLRKWDGMSLGRLPAILARDLPICAGQALVDRNLGGVRGRLEGYRTGVREHAYPGELIESPPGRPLRALARRWRRRARLRRGH